VVERGMWDRRRAFAKRREAGEYKARFESARAITDGSPYGKLGERRREKKGVKQSEARARYH